MGTAIDSDGAPIRLVNYHDCGEEVLIGWDSFDGHWQRRHYLTRFANATEVHHCPACNGELNSSTVSFFPPGEPRLQGSFYNPNEVGPRRKHGEADEVKRIRPHETWGAFAMRMGEEKPAVAPAVGSGPRKGRGRPKTKDVEQYPSGSLRKQSQPGCMGGLHPGGVRPLESARVSEPAHTISTPVETDYEETERLFVEYKACGYVLQVAQRHGLDGVELFHRLREHAKTRRPSE